MRKLYRLLCYLLIVLFTKNKTRKLEHKLNLFYLTTSKMIEYIQLTDTIDSNDREIVIDFNGTYEDMCMEIIFAIDSIASNHIYHHGNETHSPVFIYKKYNVHINMRLHNMQVKDDRYRGQIVIHAGFRENR